MSFRVILGSIGLPIMGSVKNYSDISFLLAQIQFLVCTGISNVLNVSSVTQ